MTTRNEVSGALQHAPILKLRDERVCLVQEFPPPRSHVWLNTSLAVLLIVASAFCWVAGDQKQHYSLGLVIAGWVLILTAWRTFANRRRPFRNPLANVGEGIGMGALTALGFAFQIGGLVVGLFVILGVLSGAEWVLHHVH